MGRSHGDGQFKMSASSDLLWALTRKTNAFLVKRNGLQLTSEPNNVMNKHSFKYSGLANLEAVGIEDNSRGITLTTKNTKNSANPKRNGVSVDLKKPFRHVAKTIRNKTEGKFYRKDLTNKALARWYKIHKSQKVAAAGDDA